MPVAKSVTSALLFCLVLFGVWNGIAIHRAFDDLNVRADGIQLDLTVIADETALPSVHGIPQFGTKDEFFVRGRVAGRMRRPVVIALEKNRNFKSVRCPANSVGDCFFSIRIETPIEGGFSIILSSDGHQTTRVVSFLPITELFFPRLDGIVDGHVVFFKLPLRIQFVPYDMRQILPFWDSAM